MGVVKGANNRPTTTFTNDQWQLPGANVTLQWPIDLDIDPVDQTLTILDEGVLLKVSAGGTVHPLPAWNCSQL